MTGTKRSIKRKAKVYNAVVLVLDSNTDTQGKNHHKTHSETQQEYETV